MENQSEYKLSEELSVPCQCGEGECSCEEVLPVVFDFEKYQEGGKDASYWAGFYYQMSQVGMQENDIANLIVTILDHKHNIKVSEMNSDLSVQLAKIDAGMKRKEII